MNALLRELAAVCRLHTTTEKLLVVPGLSAGHQLLESLSKSGQPWLNLRPVTPFELAQMAAARELKQRRLSVLSDGESLLLIEETLREMEDAGLLCYFAPLKEAGLARILHPTLAEIRLAGIKASELDPAAFVDAAKGKEVAMLLAGYERKLAGRCLADQAEVYSLALGAIEPACVPDSILLIPAELEFARLPYHFLGSITAKEKIILPSEPVAGLDRPPGFYFSAPGHDRTGSALSRLYDPGSTEAAVDIEIFRAFGPASEIKEALRRIKKSGYSLDSAALLLAGSRYTPLVYAICERLGIPVTFAGGVPLCLTRPGRLALDLVRWQEERYSSSLLYRVFAGGDMELPAPGRMARLLREAGVGWGRHRYLPRLEALAAAQMQRAQAAALDEQGDRADYYTQQAGHTVVLKDTLAQLLINIPEGDSSGLTDFSSLCVGMAEVLTSFARISSRLDGEALKAAKEALLETARGCAGALPEKRALLRLREALESVAVGASAPLPGHLHAAGTDQPLFSQRRFTFVLGLDAGSFPGFGLQDPVLLDCERQKLSLHLPQRSDAPARRIFRLAQALASRHGRVSFSFSCFDPVEGRPSFPAAVILQAYRLRTGDSRADYSAMLSELDSPAGYFPGNFPDSLSAEEWWLSTVSGGRYRTGLPAVLSCYPGFAAGLLAEAARESMDFTAYDGRVTAQADLDPRQNSNLSLSATRIEQLAACPFAYFMRYVLRVEPPEETDYDPGAWLDPLMRGSLLHEVYCLYLREAYPHDGTPKPDAERLRALAAEMIDKAADEIPPPSGLIFEQEKEELLRGLEVFLRVEEQASGTPAWFEVPFGFGEEESKAAGLGLPGPVILTLPGGGEVRIRGRIDRIDFGSRPHRYHVWDFKTGSAYGFDERGYLRQGRQVQHALYSYAAETILRETGKDPLALVESAGYIFPTEKGEGQRISRAQSNRSLALAALEKSLDLLAAGLFCVTDDSGHCTYCEYVAACGGEKRVELSSPKKDDPGLAPWKELQDYE
ncbi:MAG: PD-(D/E)XK nuclease family protein [Dethiobacter sp.]|jgi:ATP-dependent helicase/nuclease subunit B|nr:PD-(D/E)XK nuclease family protein [Dethiobacter sp.]